MLACLAPFSPFLNWFSGLILEVLLLFIDASFNVGTYFFFLVNLDAWFALLPCFKELSMACHYKNVQSMICHSMSH